METTSSDNKKTYLSGLNFNYNYSNAYNVIIDLLKLKLKLKYIAKDIYKWWDRLKV